MFKNLKVALFLASNFLKRGNIGTAILTVMIISVIFVNLIFLSSIVSGIEETVKQQAISCAYGHIFIEPKDNNRYIDNVDGIQEKINNLPGVVGTSSRYVIGVTFNLKNRSKSGALYSINPADELVVTKIHTGLIEGEYLSESDTDEILLGMDIVGEEGVEDDESNLGGAKVGDEINVIFSNGVEKKYRLKGIFAISKMNVDRYAFITEKEMESVLGIKNQSSQILVRLDQRGDTEEIKQKIMGLGINENVKIKTWEEKISGVIGSIISLFSIVILTSTVVSLIVAIIVIFIIIYINTANKIKQIGILKAIGINQKIIINSYIIQALFYCFFGIFIGLFLLYFLTSYLVANPISTPLGNIEPLVEQQFIIQSIISLIIVSLISGFIPSWHVAKKSILNAIWES